MRAIAEFFKVLSDESRLQILWLLSNHKELCVCDIVEALKITQSKASRHLTTLRHARLVMDRKVGAWAYYSLCPVTDELERAQLDALLVSMPRHPGAADILANLQAWLADSKRGSTCVEGGACGPKGPCVEKGASE